ncbi:hypothetical protein HDU76_007687 [Blyttiomyces sp. JEL0837]|nr:hypothetical protein HDU76_007687 [Blyttiomyces sp. JEL0837]
MPDDNTTDLDLYGDAGMTDDRSRTTDFITLHDEDDEEDLYGGYMNKRHQYSSQSAGSSGNGTPAQKEQQQQSQQQQQQQRRGSNSGGGNMTHSLPPPPPPSQGGGQQQQQQRIVSVVDGNSGAGSNAVDESMIPKIFVGGLSRNTTKESLRQYFSKYATVMNAHIMMDSQTGHSRGYGFVDLDSFEPLEQIFSEQHVIDGKSVDVKRAFRKAPGTGGSGNLPDAPNKSNAGSSSTEPCLKIFVGGLSHETTDQGLKDYFSQFGTVSDALVMMDRNTSRSRGFGFVTFVDVDSVDAVVERQEKAAAGGGADGGEGTEGIVIDGKKVEVKRALPKDKIASASLPRKHQNNSSGNANALNASNMNMMNAMGMGPMMGAGAGGMMNNMGMGGLTPTALAALQAQQFQQQLAAQNYMQQMQMQMMMMANANGGGGGAGGNGMMMDDEFGMGGFDGMSGGAGMGGMGMMRNRMAGNAGAGMMARGGAGNMGGGGASARFNPYGRPGGSSVGGGGAGAGVKVLAGDMDDYDDMDEFGMGGMIADRFGDRLGDRMGGGPMRGPAGGMRGPMRGGGGNAPPAGLSGRVGGPIMRRGSGEGPVGPMMMRGGVGPRGGMMGGGGADWGGEYEEDDFVPPMRGGGGMMMDPMNAGPRVPPRGGMYGRRDSMGMPGNEYW